MSIFDIFSKENGVFIYPPSSDPIKPEAYGYWSIGWSHELSIKFLSDLKKDNAEFPMVCMNSYLSYLQLLAFYSAIHWVYAVHVLNVPVLAQEKMNVGFEDGVNAITDPDSKLIPESLKKYFRRAFSIYFRAVSDDLNFASAAIPEVFNPDASRASAVFVSEIETTHLREEDKISDSEKYLLGQIIADISVSVLSAMQQRGVAYKD